MYAYFVWMVVRYFTVLNNQQELSQKKNVRSNILFYFKNGRQQVESVSTPHWKHHWKLENLEGWLRKLFNCFRNKQLRWIHTVCAIHILHRWRRFSNSQIFYIEWCREKQIRHSVVVSILSLGKNVKDFDFTRKYWRFYVEKGEDETVFCFILQTMEHSLYYDDFMSCLLDFLKIYRI